MQTLDQLPIAIHADAANLQDIAIYARMPLIKGITTNPSLLRKAGVTNYEAFARAALDEGQGKPVSLEVLADDLDEMERQALVIAGWGANAVVKIPITLSDGMSTAALVGELGARGVQVNVTAITNFMQLMPYLNMPASRCPLIASVFAGRIADAGTDPEPVMEQFADALRGGRTQLLWASVREPFNIVQAARCGASIITVPPAILAKAIEKWGADMGAESLALAAMFARDGREAGLVV